MLRCSRPMKCHVGAASTSAGALATSSCARFSPTSVTPAASTARTASTGCVLVAATSRTASGGRPAARAAAAMRSRTAATRAATSGAVPSLTRAPRPRATTTPCRPVTPSRRYEKWSDDSTVHTSSTSTASTPARVERDADRGAEIERGRAVGGGGHHGVAESPREPGQRVGPELVVRRAHARADHGPHRTRAPARAPRPRPPRSRRRPHPAIRRGPRHTRCRSRSRSARSRRRSRPGRGRCGRWRCRRHPARGACRRGRPAPWCRARGAAAPIADRWWPSGPSASSTRARFSSTVAGASPTWSARFSVWNGGSEAPPRRSVNHASAPPSTRWITATSCAGRPSGSARAPPGSETPAPARGRPGSDRATAGSPGRRSRRRRARPRRPPRHRRRAHVPRPAGRARSRAARPRTGRSPPR